MTTWQQLRDGQDQVLGRGQGLRHGLSEDAWQWKLDRGLWQPVLPGVAATHSGQVTDGQADVAAVVKAGRGAVLAGDAALRVLGFPFKELKTVDVAVADRPAPKAQLMSHGVRYQPHSVQGLARMMLVREGLPQMEASYAVLHAAAWAASDRAAEWRITTSVQRGIATPTELRQALQSLPRLTRRALVRIVLDDVELGAHAMSELDFLRLCRSYRLPEPDELQVRVRVGGSVRYLDGLYREQRVRAEIDGAHHRSVEIWEADVLRSNDLAISSRGRDEIQLRFTAGQVRHQSWLVAKQLHAALGC